MEVPKTVKTDNGPAYTSTGFAKLCSEFSISNKTGIAYTPQGQAIVEDAHHMLKAYLYKTKKGEYGSIPRDHFIFYSIHLNFLTVDAQSCTAVDQHWQPDSSGMPHVKSSR